MLSCCLCSGLLCLSPLILLPPPPLDPAMLVIFPHTDLPFLLPSNHVKRIFALITLPALSSMSSDNNHDAPRQLPNTANFSVAQALEAARGSAEGAQDDNVKNILETAVRAIWGRIQAQPTTYVMSREEFAVFNYFQNRFQGQGLAVDARKRYWDRYHHLSNGN